MRFSGPGVEKIPEYPFGLFQPGIIHHQGSPAFLGHKEPVIGTVLVFPQEKRNGLFSQGIGKQIGLELVIQSSDFFPVQFLAPIKQLFNKYI